MASRTTHITLSGDQKIDWILRDRSNKWDWNAGEARILTWSLVPSDASDIQQIQSNLNSLYNSTPKNFIDLTSSTDPIITKSVATIKEAFADWENVANIKFNQITETQTFKGDIRAVGFSPDRSVPAGAPPGLGSSGGMVYFQLNPEAPNSENYNNYTPIRKDVALHEIGHILGLGNDIGLFPSDKNLDTYRNYNDIDSVMSYHGNNVFISADYASLGILDIAAIQYLYGPNMNYNSGDTIYKWESDAKFCRTIWDAGGIDTIDLSNYTHGSNLNLNEGTRSDINYGGNNSYFGSKILGIAYGAKIENARGTQGDDLITGNALGVWAADGLESAKRTWGKSAWPLVRRPR